MQVDYALGNGGRSWVIGVGTDYPKYLWHKQSYASLINWASRQGFLSLPLDVQTFSGFAAGFISQQRLQQEVVSQLTAFVNAVTTRPVNVCVSS